MRPVLDVRGSLAEVLTCRGGGLCRRREPGTPTEDAALTVTALLCNRA